jgi:hypothetical protein
MGLAVASSGPSCPAFPSKGVCRTTVMAHTLGQWLSGRAGAVSCTSLLQSTKVPPDLVLYCWFMNDPCESVTFGFSPPAPSCSHPPLSQLASVVESNGDEPFQPAHSIESHSDDVAAGVPLFRRP